MVAKFSETPVLGPTPAGAARASADKAVGPALAGLPLRGQLLLEKANTLEQIATVSHGLRGLEGVALRVAAEACTTRENYFIRDRIFAVIRGDGSVCLRVPEEIATDLIENGLCFRSGKNLLTRPVANAWHLKVNGRILLQAYRNITSPSPAEVRRMWSDFVTL